MDMYFVGKLYMFDTAVCFTLHAIMTSYECRCTGQTDS